MKSTDELLAEYSLLQQEEERRQQAVAACALLLAEAREEYLVAQERAGLARAAKDQSKRELIRRGVLEVAPVEKKKEEVEVCTETSV